MPTTLTQPDEELRIVSRRGEPTWEIAQSWPLQGDWTEEDYLANRDRLDGLVELSDGCLEFPPMPVPYHQDILLFLLDCIRDYVKPRNIGRVYPAPMAIRLERGRFREPDIVFLRPERIKDRRRQPDGADLVLEIVSSGDDARDRDLETKRHEYARAGINEYWIVDPETNTIHVLTLDGVADGEPYRVHGQFKPGETATSILLDGFQVDVRDVFVAGEGHSAD